MQRPRRQAWIGSTSLVCVLATLLITTLGTWQIMRSRAAALDDAEQSVRQLTRTLAQHAARTIQAVDLTMVNGEERVERGRAPEEVIAGLDRQLEMLKQVSGLALTDAEGAQTAAARGGLGALAAAVAWHREHAANDLHIAEPTAADSAQPRGIGLSRRFRSTDAGFGGVIASEIDPEFFRSFYSGVKIGRDGTAALWTPSGLMLVRFPAPSLATTGRPMISPVIAEAGDAGQLSGVRTMKSPWDGVDRIFAFERVDNYPLYVSAAMAMHEALGGWRREATVEGAAIAIVSIALICLGFGFEKRRRSFDRLEVASWEADRRYRLLAENSGEVICVMSRKRDARSYVSPSSEQVVGWSPDEIARRPLVEMIHPEDYRRVIAELARLRPTRPRLTSLHRARHKAGHYLWLEAVFQLVEDGDILIAARDVTARQNAEAALLASETRYRLLADASSDVVQHMDLQGRRLYVSPSSTEILGFAPDELVGTGPTAFVMPEDQARVAGLLTDIGLGRRERVRGVHRIRHKAGHLLWVETQYRLVRDPVSGEPAEIVASLRDITERELLRQEVEEANRHLLVAEEIAHVGHWRIDLKRNHVSWSDEIFRMHGVDPQKFVLTIESGLNCYHPEDRFRMKRCIADAFSTGKAFDCRLRIMRPSGEIRHVLSQGRCDRDPISGRVFALFGAIVDITEQTQIERALHQKSALLQATLDNMDQGLIKVSPDGTVELANRRVKELLKLRDQTTDAPLPKFTSQLALGTREYRLPGGVILEVRTVPTPDGSIVSTVQDITARRNAEIAIRESQARYRIITDTTSDMITQLDLSYIRRYVSPACRKILGFEPEELIGTRPSQAAHPEDAAQLRALAEQLVSGGLEGDRTYVTYRTLHKDGHYVWVEASISLVRDAVTGEPAGLISSVRDVTERQRTAHHLLQAKTAAEAAARAKSEFLANMSHELRTPLTGMLGVHDLLRADPNLGDAQRRLLGLASEAGKGLLCIVNDVLDLSKLEAGQCRIEAIPFDLRRLVATCQGLAREGMGAKPVELATVYPDGSPEWFIGDPTRLQQVLLNLLTNATKFTQEGRVTVEVRFDPGTESLTVVVADTGTGIEEDKLPFLFERFSQADNSISRRFGGTGLGLAICRSLVHLMGGRVGVQSRLGKGSRFWFELPLQRVDQDKRHDRGEPAAARFQPRRILLAEDNLINQEVITAMLASRGHSVTVVSDGAEAIRSVESGSSFDLVLMDVQMPGVDGLRATAAIRKLENGNAKHLPIVGLTANAMAEDVDRCLAAGMNAHVAKPIEWPRLFAAIDAEAAA